MIAPAAEKSPSLRVVGPLLELHARDQLRDQEVVVGIALAVRVRRQVGRHAGDPGREVGAVVDVEAAHIVLVRLALAAVLADRDARHRLEDLGRTIDRPPLHLLGAHDALRAGVGKAQQPIDRLVEVGERAERARARHEHVGVEGDAQHHLDASGQPRLEIDRADRGGEAREPKVEPVAAGRQQGLESAVRVSRERPLRSPADRSDANRHARKRTTDFVARASLQPAVRLLRGQGRPGGQQSDGEQPEQPFPHRRNEPRSGAG